MEKKEGIIVLLGVGTLAAVALLAKPAEGEGAAIQIEILDAQGNPLPHDNSIAIEEGGSYTLLVRVINTSMRGGVPWPADLRVTVALSIGPPIGGIGLIAYDAVNSFVAEGLQDFTFPFTVPTPCDWDYGVTAAAIYDPADNMLAQVTEDLIIGLYEIVYGATVDIVGV